MIDRRSLCAGAAGVAAALLAGCGAGRGGPLRVATVDNVVAEAMLAGLRPPANVPGIGPASFVALPTPDALRTTLTSGQVDLAVLPTTAAAGLARRGIDVRLVGVIDSALLTVVGPSAGPPGWAGLRDRTVAMAFRGDVTDVVTRVLARANGLEPDRDVRFSYVPQIDAVTADLVAGRSDRAVLPDVATARVLAASDGRLVRRLDLAREWAAVTGHRLSAMSLSIRGEVADADPMLLGALRGHLREAAGSARADSPVVGAVAAATRSPESLVRAVLVDGGAAFRPGPEARADVEVLVDRVLAESPQLVGGGRPDARFYG